MAIPFLSDIKLNGNQIKELVVDHKSSSQPTSGYHGQLIFRTDENKIYINTSTTFNSPSWSSIAGDITGITAGNGLVGSATTGDVTIDVGPSKGISVSANRVSVDPDDVTLNFDGSSDAAKLQLKEIATARILGNVSGNSAVPTALTKANVLSMINVADGAQVNVGTNLTVTENNTTVDIASSTGSNDTIQAATTSKAGVMTKDDKSKLDGIAASANNYSLDLTKLNAVTSAMNENSTLTFGDAGDDTTVVIKGDLTVIGTTTTNNVETVSTSNGVIFEGSAADANEGTLKAGTLTNDRTYTLPDASGTVALTSDITGTNSGTNTGDEPDATTSVKGVVELATNTEANAGTSTSRAVTPANLGAYTGSSTITTVGTIATGVWQGSAISTDYIANTSGTNTGDEPNASTSTRGVIEIATTTEASTGTDTGRAVTPAGVKQFDDDRKYVETITSAISANASYDVDHGLGTRDVIVKVYALVADLTTSGTNIVAQYDEVQIDVNHATDAKVTITPNIAIRAVATGSLRVLVKSL